MEGINGLMNATSFGHVISEVSGMDGPEEVVFTLSQAGLEGLSGYFPQTGKSALSQFLAVGIGGDGHSLFESRHQPLEGIELV